MPDTVPMRPVAKLIPFDEARDQFLALFPPSRRSEAVPLADAFGRVAATDHRAPFDVPSFDRSAMDGYAVRASDTSGATADRPRTLQLRGAIHAGPQGPHDVRKGECFQIATGAPLPRVADAVVMVEHTTLEGDRVLVRRAVRARENVSSRGGDLRSSDIAVARGSVLHAPRLAVLAAIGLATANVHDRPRVLLLSTGTELRSPGQNLEPGLIYDSNTPALAALLAAHGARVERAGIIPDDERLMRKALERAHGFDLALVTGSSSAGERDYLVDAVHELGTVRYHGVNVKPGKPLLLADLQGVPVFGLAGNPASCLLMAHVLVVPALRRFQHLPPVATPTLTAKLGHDLASPKGKRHFAPVRVTGGEAQSVYKESDATTSLSNADGYVEIAEDVETLPRGTLVEIHPF